LKFYKNILYTLLLGFVFLRFSVSFLIITSFPELGSTFELNNFQLGTLISLYFLTSAIFIFIWIRLFGKYSKFKIFIISSIIWISGTIFISFSENYPTLLISSCIIGIGIESSAIIILLILFQITPKENQGKILSIFMAAQGAGGIFNVFLTAYFEDILNLEWNFIFFFIGGISLLWFIITVLMLAKFKQLKVIIIPSLEKIRYDFNAKMLKRIIRKKTNLNLIILLMYSVPIVFFFSLWIQLYYIDYHSLTQMEAAISYIFLTGGEFLGMIIGGLLYDKVHSGSNYKKIYIAFIGLLISIPLLAIGFLIFWEKNHLNTQNNLISLVINLLDYVLKDIAAFSSYVMLFIGFFSFAFIYPFFLILINDCNDENDKGTMIGFRNLIEIIGQGISPLIGGFIADIFSISVVLVMVPIFLILPLIHLLYISRIVQKDLIAES